MNEMWFLKAWICAEAAYIKKPHRLRSGVFSGTAFELAKVL